MYRTPTLTPKSTDKPCKGLGQRMKEIAVIKLFANISRLIVYRSLSPLPLQKNQGPTVRRKFSSCYEVTSLQQGAAQSQTRVEISANPKFVSCVDSPYLMLIKVCLIFRHSSVSQNQHSTRATRDLTSNKTPRKARGVETSAKPGRFHSPPHPLETYSCVRYVLLSSYLIH